MTDEYDDQTGEDFAQLLEESLKGRERPLRPGERITATVLAVGDEWVFIDIGRKGEGVVDRKEILDDGGNPTVSPGDGLTVWFLGSSHGEMRFTTRMGKGTVTPSLLEEAYRSGIPVEGTVEGEIKGGYQVRLPGSVRGFCPFSAMGRREGESPVGTTLQFLITQWGEGGRNVVLSHRAFLEAERRTRREELKERLAIGDRLEGTVASIQKFGVFVDIGGVEGLVPLSELAWGRVSDPSELVSVGDRVRAVVKGIDWERERITLSMKEEGSDPWNDVTERFRAGSYATGTVTRLAPFGAFVTIAPGIDGLIPISRLSTGKRIAHPREVLKEGETVEVTIESVDPENRRISLAPAAERRRREEEEETVSTFMASSSGGKGLGTLGDLLKKKLGG